MSDTSTVMDSPSLAESSEIDSSKWSTTGANISLNSAENVNFETEGAEEWESVILPTKARGMDPEKWRAELTATSIEEDCRLEGIIQTRTWLEVEVTRDEAFSTSSKVARS